MYKSCPSSRYSAQRQTCQPGTFGITYEKHANNNDEWLAVNHLYEDKTIMCWHLIITISMLTVVLFCNIQSTRVDVV